jgi:hypothetical protein
MHPDEILQQIQQLADAYVQAGGDPNALMDAVAGEPGEPGADQEGQGDMQGDIGGGPPPDEALAGMLDQGDGSGNQNLDQMPMMSGNTPMPDISGMAPDGGVPSGSSLADASAMAQQDMLKRMKKR